MSAMLKEFVPKSNYSSQEYVAYFTAQLNQLMEDYKLVKSKVARRSIEEEIAKTSKILMLF